MFDFAVIGSGVSGGRMAYELTVGGAKCLLLEAGNEFDSNVFPLEEIDYSSQMFWNGGAELSADAKLLFLRGKCLGGTSVLNQALLDRFDDFAWDNWQDKTRIKFFNAQDMEPHYLACEQTIEIQRINEKDINENARIFMQGFNKLHYGWDYLHRGQSDCQIEKGSDCIACLGGCPRNSKQSSLVTTIRLAREKGLAVKSNFEVHHLNFAANEVEVVGQYQGKSEKIIVPKVVLAAGAIGNSAILLRSGLKKMLPALGKNFLCHPQKLFFAVFPEPIDAHKHAFQGVKSNDIRIRRAGVKFENVFSPPIAIAFLSPLSGKKHMQWMQKYRHLACIEAAIQDEGAGYIEVDKQDNVLINKKLTAADQQKLQYGTHLIKEVFASVGAKEMIVTSQVFGLHLMGGCSIGTDSANSVIGPDFTLHSHSNVAIADSSIFPASPGINPSFTIMALSHRSSQKLLGK